MIFIDFLENKLRSYKNQKNNLNKGTADKILEHSSLSSKTLSFTKLNKNKIFTDL